MKSFKFREFLFDLKQLAVIIFLLLCKSLFRLHST